MTYTVSFATTGLMILSGDRNVQIHLRHISSYADNNVTLNFDYGPDALHQVILNENGNTLTKYFIDIGDVTSPVYATTQDLLDDINDAIEAMYTGGGGGGGTVDSISWTSQNGMNVNVGGTAADPILLPVGVEAILRPISQANAFTQGQAIKVEDGGGGAHALAQGDDAGNASFVGFYYNSGAGANPWNLLMPGSWAAIFTGLTAGAYHYLDPAVAGGLTDVPNAFGPVLKATSTTAGYVLSNAAHLDFIVPTAAAGTSTTQAASTAFTPKVRFNMTAQAGAVFDYRDGTTASGEVTVYPTDDGLVTGNVIYSAVVVLSVLGIAASAAVADAVVAGNIGAADGSSITAYMFTGNPSIILTDNGLAAARDNAPVRVWFVGIPI